MTTPSIQYNAVTWLILSKWSQPYIRIIPIHLQQWKQIVSHLKNPYTRRYACARTERFTNGRLIVVTLRPYPLKQVTTVLIWVPRWDLNLFIHKGWATFYFQSYYTDWLSLCFRALCPCSALHFTHNRSGIPASYTVFLHEVQSNFLRYRLLVSSAGCCKHNKIIE